MKYSANYPACLGRATLKPIAVADGEPEFAITLPV